MGKGLNKTELTGIILLALLIAVVTLCALFVRRCDGAEEEAPEFPNAKVIEAAGSAGEVKDYSPGGGSKGKSTRKKSGGRKKSAAKTSKSVKAHEEPVFLDPFADTIPVEWDEEEIY